MNKTKITAVALALTGVLALGAGAATVQQITTSLRPDITLKVDGKNQPMVSQDGSAVYPISYNGTTYLPIRVVAEALGKDVDWDDKTQTVVLTARKDREPEIASQPTDQSVASYESRIAELEKRTDALTKTWNSETYRTLDRDVDNLDDEMELVYRTQKLTREQYKTLENRLDKVDNRLDKLDDIHDDDWDDDDDDRDD